MRKRERAMQTYHLISSIYSYMPAKASILARYSSLINVPPTTPKGVKAPFFLLGGKLLSPSSREVSASFYL